MSNITKPFKSVHNSSINSNTNMDKKTAITRDNRFTGNSFGSSYSNSYSNTRTRDNFSNHTREREHNKNQDNSNTFKYSRGRFNKDKGENIYKKDSNRVIEETSTYSNLIDLAMKKKYNNKQENDCNPVITRGNNNNNNNNKDNKYKDEDEEFPVLGRGSGLSNSKKNIMSDKYKQKLSHNYSDILKTSLQVGNNSNNHGIKEGVKSESNDLKTKTCNKTINIKNIKNTIVIHNNNDNYYKKRCINKYSRDNDELSVDSFEEYINNEDDEYYEESQNEEDKDNDDLDYEDDYYYR